MNFIDEIEKINKVIENIEKSYIENSKRLNDINETINKLLQVIELDTFNCAKGYNYAKMLKEPLVRKRIGRHLNSEYKSILTPYRRSLILRKMNKKKKELEIRRYKPRLIKEGKIITELIEKEL